MTGVLIALLVVAVCAYVAAPVAVRAKFWFSADPSVAEISAADPRIPATVSTFTRHVATQLERLGFAPCACLLNTDTCPGVTGYLTLFENRATGDLAAPIAVLGEAHGGQSVGTYYVEFDTEFADGTVRDTNNSDQLPDVYAPPWRSTARAPRLADLGQLYQIHQALVERHGGVKRPLPPAREHPSRLKAQMVRDLQTKADAGYHFLDASQRRFRPTLKGAVLGAWGMLPPASLIRRWLVARRARRLLAELGFPTTYPVVDYARLPAEPAPAPQAPGETPAPAADLQFDRAEFAEPVQPASSVLCTTCQQPIPAWYFEVNGRVTCPPCRDNVLRSTRGGSAFLRFLRATGAGLLAGVIGAGIYFAVTLISGYEIGLVALVVGLLVGGAVRWGARSRGGWFYQALAILLTYLAVAECYSALAAKEFYDDPSRLAELQGDVPAVFLYISIVLIGVALPIIHGVQHPISLLIIGIAFYEAWRINKRPRCQITGPYAVAAAATPPPAPVPPAPVEGASGA